MTTDNAAAVSSMVAPAAGPTAPSPALAAAKLHQLTSDSAWGARYLAGDSEARATFNELTKAIANGDAVGDALAGNAPPAEPFAVQTIVGDELPAGMMQSAVADMLLRGLTNEAVTDVLSGKTFSREVVRAAEDLRARLMHDPVASAAYLKGDPGLGKTMLVCNSIIKAGVTP
jgi:hypothetical protein